MKMMYSIHRYTHAEKIWNFLRYDHSNKVVTENELHSTKSFGPISLFKCPDRKVASPNGNVSEIS